MALIDLISSDVIRLPLVSRAKYEIIRELVDILRDAQKISDADAVYDAVIEREEKGSTGLEDGIAVPHAKSDAVDDLTLALGVAPAGVDFEALDGEPSHLIFLLVAPHDKSGPHIEALAEIAKITRSRAFCQSIINATSTNRVADLFSDED